MHSSLASGKSATPPARCIHRPQRDTSSAEYRLLVSRASVGASRELSSRRSPALIPHTCAVSPTFRYGAFSFVASALAAVPPARLIACRNRASANWESRRLGDATVFPLCLRIALRYSASPLTTCKGLCARAQTESRTGFPRISWAQRRRQISLWSCHPIHISTITSSGIRLSW